MAGIDFATLRNQTLASGNDEEAVTVNTRALIDKVLARYSGEWTTLRELIQNAADAQASTVRIRFETSPSAQVPLSNTTNESEVLKHVLLHHTLKRLVVQNDGQAFGENDWTRLKRIAEGNPDETKIGAFGVGFYSVFADCEDPFVSSGNQAMAFYWKGNSLFTRRLQLPEEQGSKDTSFVLDYRTKNTPMPSLTSIAQFLATSLTFVAIQNIELWLDDWKVVTLQKKTAPASAVAISRDVETRTQDKHMKVQAVEKESVQLSATFMSVIGWKPAPSITASQSSTFTSSRSNMSSIQSFFSKLAGTSHQTKNKVEKEEQALQEAVLEDLTALSTSHVFLKVTTARIETFLSKEFAEELKRATKKPPPKTTRLAILTSSYDDTAASTKSEGLSKSINVFSSVLPGNDRGGRVFIGFPTQQTTGAGFHLSAPSVIPTVERESIDLNARWVNVWNLEMLRVAGILARLSFAGEMLELGDRLKRVTNSSKITKETIAQFLPEALHIYKSFTFVDSTPSYKVGECINEAFWKAYKKPYIEIFSTRGVLLTKDVRLATEDLSGFVDGIPVVPEELVQVGFVQKLKEYGLLEEITVRDVKRELEMKALSAEQLVAFIKWAGRKVVNGSIDRATMASILEVAVATINGLEGSSTQVIALSTIKTYPIASRIPPDLPTPPDTIPFNYVKDIPLSELQALGWVALDIVPWLRFLIESQGGHNGLTEDQNITQSPTFAAQVLHVLSKQWDSLNQGEKTLIVSMLEARTVIPTRAGMKKPTESYFNSVKLFDDLPIIAGCPGVKEKFLSAVGVRKTVELTVIFDRLLSPSDKSSVKWSHVDLIKYLASVQKDIPAVDIERLKSTPICPAESNNNHSTPTTRLYKVGELYEPKDRLRELQLPTLYWFDPKKPYSPLTAEGQFLSLLGLRPYPSVPELVTIMASADYVLRNNAMRYFIDNHQVHGYFKFSVAGYPKAFLPLDGDHKQLSAPGECFTNARAADLGFNILRSDLHSHAAKFGVATDPPLTSCIQRLLGEKRPKDPKEARILFTYFAGRLNEIDQMSISKLGNALIVPVKSTGLAEGSRQQRYATPKSCFLGSSSTYQEIFDFVDFGPEANSFLLKCGSKHEPSKAEIAQMMVANPAHLLGITGPDKYLGLLRSLADSYSDLRRNKELFKKMKSSPWLLATQEIPVKSKKQHLDAEDLEDADEEPTIKEWKLACPSQIVIMDDIVNYRLFKEVVLCAPQEDMLEDLYEGLGTPQLGSLIKENMHISPAAENRVFSQQLRELILERTKIFFHDQSPSSIKHDAKWLEKTLSIKVAKSIALTRSLSVSRKTHTESRSAAVQKDGSASVLYVTASYDMFQVSQVLMPLLVNKPKTHLIMMLEMLLTSDLYRLKTRGYNVDRILRAKAAEARVAKDLQRQREMEAEQKQIKEREAQSHENNNSSPDNNSLPNEEGLDMPGSFNTTEDADTNEKRRSRGLFSDLTRRLGHFRGMINDSVTPPPSYNESQNGHTVTPPDAVHQNLVNAIKSSRSYDSNTLFSPPTTRNVKETTSYCDKTHEHNIQYISSAANGMRIFTTKGAAATGAAFVQANVKSLDAFAACLATVAAIYDLPSKTMHIFVDEKASTIAFNSGGSIFANFTFFNHLHRDESQKGDALIYWFVTVAHELAHNLVKQHDSQHSYYTESFVQQYFSKAVAVISNNTSPPGS